MYQFEEPAEKEYDPIFWGRPEGAVAQDGLSIAERSQLNLNYAADPEAFELLERFCGKHVDEREELLRLIRQHGESEEVVAQNDEEYKVVWQRFPPDKSQPVGRAAAAAAGLEMRRVKKEHTEQSAGLHGAYDNFSTLLAGFCLENFAGKPLTLVGRKRVGNGQAQLLHAQRFVYAEGYLTQDKIVYASAERTVAHKLLLMSRASGTERDRIKVFAASKVNWLDLLGGLEMISLY